jgi:hypothetical protein
MHKNNMCNNCGKQGHLFHQCKHPITSYGIILYKKSEKGLQYLMIRRKDSFGYIDFIRGKYVQHNYEQLQNIFNEMSVLEREKILLNDFETLWKMMWGETSINVQYKIEENMSQKKFDALRKGLPIGKNGDLINLDNLIKNSTSIWPETEWEFPKGRRNYQEKDLDCAIREFQEETGLCKNDIHIIENYFKKK